VEAVLVTAAVAVVLADIVTLLLEKQLVVAVLPNQHLLLAVEQHTQ
jgi:hypothetical protein